MDADTLKRLMLGALNDHGLAPRLASMDPLMADLATALKGKKWPIRLTDWCVAQALPVNSLEVLHVGLRHAVEEQKRREEDRGARQQIEKAISKLKGTAYSVEKALQVGGVETAVEWLEQADLPGLVASMPKPKKSQPELKVV